MRGGRLGCFHRPGVYFIRKMFNLKEGFKMNDEQGKLIAKIQFFYDIMVNRLTENESDSILDQLESHRECSKAKAAELHNLVDEYSKVFEPFLYKDRS